MRYPVVAGSFYSSSRAKLEKEIKSNTKRVTRKNFSHGLVPHAGYVYSGDCLKEVYSNLKKPDTFIILGPNHSSKGSDVAIDNRPWLTPFGAIEIDLGIVGELNEKIPFDLSVHDNEYSIEVQLPFIKSLFPKAEFVPICIKRCDPSLLGEFIKEVINRSNKKISVLASSDLSHYGKTYNFTPFDNTKSIEIDKKILKSVADLDFFAFQELSNKTNICGKYSIMTLMQIMKEKGKVLKYCNSSLISGDKKNFVGYGSVVFK